MSSTRYPAITPEGLTPEQKKVYDFILPMLSKNFDKAQDKNSALIGLWQHYIHLPFKVFYEHSQNYKALAQIPDFPLRCREVLILTIGEYYGASYILYSHTRIAKAVGLSDVQIESILENKPPGGTEQESLCWEIVRALICPGLNGSQKSPLPEDLWERAKNSFGKMGVSALLQWTAFYSGLAMILNGAAVPVPEGEIIWPLELSSISEEQKDKTVAAVHKKMAVAVAKREESFRETIQTEQSREAAAATKGDKEKEGERIQTEQSKGRMKRRRSRSADRDCTGRDNRSIDDKRRRIEVATSLTSHIE
ncbi:hypothetical protein TWF694_005416 [Orbilia ellipsospora]|uniref:Carboxymuconolactone decarboxylase-like domain-containing protein n=1 Tax=Orbilia ellipsospora TaxID=2528407 RepID=A0AAV9WT58_9PEZI